MGTRIAAAFVQSAAVRAAGFAIVPLNSLAPAVKILYVIMMVSHVLTPPLGSTLTITVHFDLPYRPVSTLDQRVRREVVGSVRGVQFGR